MGVLQQFELHPYSGLEMALWDPAVAHVVYLSAGSFTSLGTVGRKTRRAEDVVNYSKVFAPVLSRAVGVPPPNEHPSLQR